MVFFAEYGGKDGIKIRVTTASPLRIPIQASPLLSVLIYATSSRFISIGLFFASGTLIKFIVVAPFILA